MTDSPIKLTAIRDDDPLDSSAPAARAVNAIFADLRDRRYLKWIFGPPGSADQVSPGLDRIADHVQVDIAEIWREIIAKAFEPIVPPAAKKVEAALVVAEALAVQQEAVAHMPGAFDDYTRTKARELASAMRTLIEAARFAGENAPRTKTAKHPAKRT